MNKKIRRLTKSAVIAAVYAVMTLLSGAFGLAYGNVQFRISEMLCVLPVYSSSAVAGLTVGCVIANIFSSVNPLDTVIGSLATLFAAVLSRKCRTIAFKDIPVVSMLFPVLFNAVFVGAEIAFFSGSEVFLPVFFANALSVGAGEAVVVFVFGTALILFTGKNDRLRKMISD